MNKRARKSSRGFPPPPDIYREIKHGDKGRLRPVGANGRGGRESYWCHTSSTSIQQLHTTIAAMIRILILLI